MNNNIWVGVTNYPFIIHAHDFHYADPGMSHDHCQSNPNGYRVCRFESNETYNSKNNIQYRHTGKYLQNKPFVFGWDFNDGSECLVWRKEAIQSESCSNHSIYEKGIF